MPSSTSTSIAVVGAAGFLGRELLRQFEAAEIKVTAVIRGFADLSVEGDFHRATSAADLAGERFDLVINLAYPTSGALFEQAAATDAIIETVDGLLTNGGRLLHVSTQAVFGITLNRPVVLGPAPAIRDMAYVESKITAEHRFAEIQKERDLSCDIVRLGNLWGPASGAWVLPTVRNLLTGRPAAVRDVPGYSNTTEVGNVASYLLFLVREASQDRGVRFHHLAEFSAVRWQEWVDPIAEALGVDPVYAEESWLDAPSSAKDEVGLALAPVRVRTFYSKLAGERVAGSMLRSLIRKLPPRVQEPLRNEGLIFAPTPELDRIQQIILENMAGHQEFRTVVDDRWTPPISQGESLQRILDWLAQT